MKSILLTPLLTLIYLNCHACICIKETDKFSLSEYDQSTNIIEVKVISEYKSKNTEKPKLLIDYGLQKGYNVRILEVFKGNHTAKDTIIGFSYNSSCTWTPKVNKQYIFYTDYLDGITLCNKKIEKNKDSNKYKIEKNHLKQLSQKDATIKILDKNSTLIEGRISKGIRNGIWTIKSNHHENKVAIKLIYENGILVDLCKESGFNMLFFSTYQFYQKRLYLVE